MREGNTNEENVDSHVMIPNERRKKKHAISLTRVSMEVVDFLLVHVTGPADFFFSSAGADLLTNTQLITLSLSHLHFFRSLSSFNYLTRLSSLLFMESSEAEQRDGGREDGKINNSWLQTHVHHSWK